MHKIIKDSLPSLPQQNEISLNDIFKIKLRLINYLKKRFTMHDLDLDQFVMYSMFGRIEELSFEVLEIFNVIRLIEKTSF